MPSSDNLTAEYNFVDSLLSYFKVLAFITFIVYSREWEEICKTKTIF